DERWDQNHWAHHTVHGIESGRPAVAGKTSAGGAGSRRGLRRLLLFFLLGGGGRVVLRRFADAFLEFLDARSQRSCQIRQPVGAEEDQHDHEDDQQLLITQPKHDGLLSGASTILRPYAPRKTRFSPVRTVTRRASRCSRSSCSMRSTTRCCSGVRRTW